MESRPFPFARGRVLLRQGEKGSQIVVLHSGLVKVVRQEEGGKSTILAFRGPGDLVGESAVAEDGGRLADVVALTDGTAATVDVCRFRELLKSDSRREAQLRKDAVKRLREVTVARGQGEPVARLAFVLLRLVDAYGWYGLVLQDCECERGRKSLPLIHQDLGDHLGVSRSRTGKFLRRLESCGVRSHRGRTCLDIGYLPALRAAAATVDH